jgi:hypothetical protein
MDNPSDNYKSNPGTQSGPLQTLLGTIESLIRPVIGLFTLTDDEQAKAGIYLGGEGRDFDQGDD